MAKYLSVFLLFLSTIIHYGCSSMLCSGGCLLSRTSFGGRLMFIGNGGFPSWIAPKSKLVFQIPRGLDFASRSLRNSLFGSGKGKVRIGKRTKCPRSDAELDTCPSTESQPCLDTTLPCEPDACKAELNMKTSSKLNGHAHIIADWSNLPESCEVAHQSITIQQLSWDGNCAVPAEMNRPKTFRMENGYRSKTMADLPPYSTFKITLRVTSLTGVYVTSKTVKTVETRPGAAPLNVTRIRPQNKNYIMINWNEPPCGKHHGKITKYGYRMWSENGSRLVYHTTRSAAVFPITNMRASQYKFQVCAYTEIGTGPYSEVMTVNV